MASSPSDPEPRDPEPREAELAEAEPREGVLRWLAQAPLAVEGRIANASNHTLLVRLRTPHPGECRRGCAEHDSVAAGEGLAEGDGGLAVYKPVAGERPLWDFPSGTLASREVAAYEVSAFLGWGLVPPTVLRGDAPHGPGSVQCFVPHDPGRHYFHLVEEPEVHAALARMALFDLLINNADRKASHVMRTEQGEIVGCDHGLTFHVRPKLRTVIWELGGRAIEPAWAADLERLAAMLAEAESPLRQRLRGLLDEDELEALAARAETLCTWEALPEIPDGRRAYPWPPL